MTRQRWTTRFCPTCQRLRRFTRKKGDDGITCSKGHFLPDTRTLTTAWKRAAAELTLRAFGAPPGRSL